MQQGPSYRRPGLRLVLSAPVAGPSFQEVESLVGELERLAVPFGQTEQEQDAFSERVRAVDAAIDAAFRAGNITEREAVAFDRRVDDSVPF